MCGSNAATRSGSSKVNRSSKRLAFAGLEKAAKGRVSRSQVWFSLMSGNARMI